MTTAMQRIRERKAEEQVYWDAQPLRTSCTACSWTHEGTVKQGRAAALRHRERKHPEMKNTHKRKRSLKLPS